MQDDLLLVTLPGPSDGKPVALVEALEERLAMPEEGDTVRNAISCTAKELGLELRVDHEVRSVAAMKGMGKRGRWQAFFPTSRSSTKFVRAI
jgi:LysR family transcriptional regulator, nitrogen assimilation regulatory protein